MIACKSYKGDNVQEEQVALPAGTVISGRYIVKSLLGTDDSIATYLVEDQRAMSELFVLKYVRLLPMELLHCGDARGNGVHGLRQRRALLRLLLQQCFQVHGNIKPTTII